MEIQYWSHKKSGETYAVSAETRECFGPLRQEEIGEITKDDERWSREDWDWLNGEPCALWEG